MSKSGLTPEQQRTLRLLAHAWTTHECQLQELAYALEIVATAPADSPRRVDNRLRMLRSASVVGSARKQIERAELSIPAHWDSHPAALPIYESPAMSLRSMRRAVRATVRAGLHEMVAVQAAAYADQLRGDVGWSSAVAPAPTSMELLSYRQLDAFVAPTPLPRFTGSESPEDEARLMRQTMFHVVRTGADTAAGARPDAESSPAEVFFWAVAAARCIQVEQVYEVDVSRFLARDAHLTDLASGGESPLPRAVLALRCAEIVSHGPLVRSLGSLSA